MVERAAGSGSNPDAANSGGKRRENMKERKTAELVREGTDSGV